MKRGWKRSLGRRYRGLRASRGFRGLQLTHRVRRLEQTILARYHKAFHRVSRAIAARRPTLRLASRALPRPRHGAAGLQAPPVRIAVVGMLTAAMIVAILGITHVSRRQQVIRLGYELSRAIEDLSRKQEENRRLRLEKATLTNPDRIRRLARSLGMDQPGPHQIRVITDPGDHEPGDHEPDGPLAIGSPHAPPEPR